MPRFTRHVFVCTNVRPPATPRDPAQPRRGARVADPGNTLAAAQLELLAALAERPTPRCSTSLFRRRPGPRLSRTPG